MSILYLNYKELYENAKNSKTNNTKWKPSLSGSFLDHVLPILASIKLETINGKISSTDTFKSLSDIEFLDTPNGEMLGSNVQWLFKFLYYAKRGDLIVGPQIRNSRLATFTPLMLYAHKLYNNIPYSRWDREDKAMPLFLGNTLDTILEVETVPELTIEQINDYRKEALMFKTGAKAGTVDKLYNYKCTISSIEYIPLPRTVIMMLLQIWLANAAVRNTDSMILDPLDWDNVPKALDIEVLLPAAKPVTKPEPKIEVAGDLW